MRRLASFFFFSVCIVTFVGAVYGDEYDAEKSKILYNGTIYTMEEKTGTAEALLIRGNRIEAVGSFQQICSKADPDSSRIDLHGRVVFPGFLDPHTHLFNEAGSQGLTLDEAQQLALENGITAVSNMFTNPPQTEEYIRYAKEGNMKIRLFLYLIYDDSCGTIWGRWYKAFPPGNYAPRLWINGIKIFSEGSVCGDRGVRPVFSDELLETFTDVGRELWGNDELCLSDEDFTNVARDADKLGYQIAIHAIGDFGIEASLRALGATIGEHKNKNRHMVMHNYFVRDDMIDLYRRSDIIALVEPLSQCHTIRYGELVGETNEWLFKRVRDLAQTGIHMALDSDWPYTGFSGLNPMRKLYAVVTGKNTFDFYEDLEPCTSLATLDQTISVQQGLKMMTTEAAYAMRCEKRLGSLKKGKLADLVVLSDDPYIVEPAELKDIEVLLTMVDGKIEYRNPNSPDLL